MENDHIVASGRVVVAEACSQGLGNIWALRLVDRRSGSTPRINGRFVVAYSTEPEIDAVALLSGRNPSCWMVRADLIQGGGQQ